MAQPLRGIGTISLWSTDHQAAVDWYSELLGTKPYFERPGYAEFRIGDPDRSRHHRQQVRALPEPLSTDPKVRIAGQVSQFSSGDPEHQVTVIAVVSTDGSLQPTRACPWHRRLELAEVADASAKYRGPL